MLWLGLRQLLLWVDHHIGIAVDLSPGGMVPFVGALLLVWAALLVLPSLLLARLVHRRLNVHALAAVLLLQELLLDPVVGWALDREDYAGLSLARGACYGVALSLAAVLLLGVRLPDALLPLKGEWLRRLLAAGVLIGLAQVSPWWLILDQVRCLWPEMGLQHPTPSGWLPLTGALLLLLFPLRAVWQLLITTGKHLRPEPQVGG
jgi:hypothetical protein